MQKTKITTVDPRNVPAVIEVLDAQDALNAFKEEHAAVFEQLEGLVSRYNSAIENADKVCRAQKISCGPFQLYQFSTKYDAEALYNAVGRDTFLTVGGKISTKTVYDVDKGALEAAIAQARISNDVIEQVRKETPAFHAPKPVVLP